MLTFDGRGLPKITLSRNGVTISDVFDSFYERDSLTRGRQFFDGQWTTTGFEVWVGRRYLCIDAPHVARALHRLAARIVTAQAGTSSEGSAGYGQEGGGVRAEAPEVALGGLPWIATA